MESRRGVLLCLEFLESARTLAASTATTTPSTTCMRYLVMGGTGFIGSHLVDALAAASGSTVRVYSRGLTTQANWPRSGQVERFTGDFSDAASVENAVRGCEVVFHLVSTTLPKSSNENPLFDLKTNVGHTLNLLESARRNAVKKIVFVSSGGTVYGRPETTPIAESHPTNPICAHGISKLAIEKYLHLYWKLHGLDYCVLRVSNAYGGRQRAEKAQGAVAVLLDRALRGEVFEIWGDGSVVRDYVYVTDVARALADAARYHGEEKVFNIGTGRGTRLNEVVNVVEKACGRKVRRVYLAGRPFDVKENILDIAKARTHLGWRPEVTLADGVGKTLEWMTGR